MNKTKSYSLPGSKEVMKYHDLVIKLNDSQHSAAQITLPRQRRPPLVKVSQLTSTLAIVLDDGEVIFKLSSTNRTQDFFQYLTMTMSYPFCYCILLRLLSKIYVK